MAAAKLFARKGFAATSTREIAAAVGLRQPSLFHHFPTKHAMLEALLDLSLADSLAVAERLQAATGPAAARLYRVMYYDVQHLCSLPFDMGTIALDPAVRQSRFARFWRDRTRLLAAIRDIIEAGIATGEFVRIDAAVAANALVAMNEGTLGWFQSGGALLPSSVAELSATLVVRGLLRDPAKLPTIRRQADAIETPS